MTPFCQEGLEFAVALAVGGLAGAILSRRGLPWRRTLLLAGPAGILAYLALIFLGRGPGMTVSFGLLAVFIAAGDLHYPAGRPRRSFLLLCALVGLLFMQRGWGRLEALREMEGKQDLVEDGVNLQSTGYTCMAASAATCLRALGLPGTEAEMVLIGGTGTTGTSPGCMAWALSKRLEGSGWAVRDERRDWASLPRDGSPAILQTYWGGKGGISHATAFLGFEGEKAVLGEPMQGRVLATREALEKEWAWRGQGVFFARARP